MYICAVLIDDRPSLVLVYPSWPNWLFSLYKWYSGICIIHYSFISTIVDHSWSSISDTSSGPSIPYILVLVMSAYVAMSLLLATFLHLRLYFTIRYPYNLFGQHLLLLLSNVTLGSTAPWSVADNPVLLEGLHSATNTYWQLLSRGSTEGWILNCEYSFK